MNDAKGVVAFIMVYNCPSLCSSSLKTKSRNIITKADPVVKAGL